MRFNGWTTTAALGVVFLSAGVIVSAEAAPLAAYAAAGATVSTQDATFLKHAIMSDHAAIDAAKIVLQKTSNERLKGIAQTVISTHTKMLEQLESESRSSGVAVPDNGGPMGRNACSRLEGLQGKALDQEFVNDMVKLHEMEVQTFRNEASNGTSETLKGISQDQLPVIQQHLADLRGIQKNGS